MVPVCACACVSGGSSRGGDGKRKQQHTRKGDVGGGATSTRASIADRTADSDGQNARKTEEGTAGRAEEEEEEEHAIRVERTRANVRSRAGKDQTLDDSTH